MKRINPTALLLFLLTFCFALSLQALAQSKTVSGKVTSEKGAPLPNASVEIQGKKTGTTTDETGLLQSVTLRNIPLSRHIS